MIQLRDNEFKDADFNKALNPYLFLDDFNLLISNVKTTIEVVL